jgi:hypothetical protein
MSRNIKNSQKHFSKKRVGFACPSKTFKKVDLIANSIGWSKNAFVTASLIHMINMIEDETYHYIPEVVLQARALKHLYETNFEKITKLKETNSFQSTAFSFDESLLKKVDRVVFSIGWARLAFISLSINHLINLIVSDEEQFIPNIVIQARAVSKGEKIPLVMLINRNSKLSS